MVEESTVKENNFDLSKYQLSATNKKITVNIEGTDDSFEVTVKSVSWSKRNQLLSKCLQFSQSGKETSFNGDLYVREMLKEMIVEAPWGRTTESVLASLGDKLGHALETLVPSPGEAENSNSIKKG